jgi:hypothetical protein
MALGTHSPSALVLLPTIPVSKDDGRAQGAIRHAKFGTDVMLPPKQEYCRLSELSLTV